MSFAERGRTYRCLFCHLEGEKAKVERHIYTKHIDDERVPYMCIPCNFRTTSQLRLTKHQGYSSHIKRLQRLQKIGKLPAKVLSISDAPIYLGLNDMERLGHLESQGIWRDRKINQMQETSAALSSDPLGLEDLIAQPSLDEEVGYHDEVMIMGALPLQLDGLSEFSMEEVIQMASLPEELAALPEGTTIAATPPHLQAPRPAAPTRQATVTATEDLVLHGGHCGSCQSGLMAALSQISKQMSAMTTAIEAVQRQTDRNGRALRRIEDRLQRPQRPVVSRRGRWRSRPYPAKN